MNTQKLKEVAKNRIVLIGVLSLVVVVGVVGGVTQYQRNNHIKQVKQQLDAEESSEEQFAATDPTKADAYVSDFKYVANVTVTANGFNPANLVVKPQTKVIFTGGDESPHFLAVAPGSAVPKYFDPKIDVTQNSVFQTKFESSGTYSFYDRYHPQSSVVVTVSDK